jgi:hypothetical protein
VVVYIINSFQLIPLPPPAEAYPVARQARCIGYIRFDPEQASRADNKEDLLASVKKVGYTQQTLRERASDEGDRNEFKAIEVLSFDSSDQKK